MVTFDVNMLISDSGVIKYKAIAPIWYVYENDVKNKYWYFPKGLRLDQIDTTFTTEFNIEADTAYNYETKQLWHLINNVKVHNAAGDYFETNDLYWDMRNHEVYSDSFIHIERPDAIIEGYGFKSDDAFSAYELRETSGIFPFQENALSNPTPRNEESEEIVDNKPTPKPAPKPATADKDVAEPAVSSTPAEVKKPRKELKKGEVEIIEMKEVAPLK